MVSADSELEEREKIAIHLACEVTESICKMYIPKTLEYIRLNRREIHKEIKERGEKLNEMFLEFRDGKCQQYQFQNTLTLYHLVYLTAINEAKKRR